MDSVICDIRSALRAMVSRPGATAVIIISMALGIGANVGVFSVVNAVLLRPLPYRDPGALVWITNGIPRFNAEMASGADFLDWREESRTLISLTAFTSGANLTLAGREEPERVTGASVSASFFATLGIAPAQGRVFEAADERLNAAPVVIVTHGLWLRLFGSVARLEAQTITLDDRPYTIVGVLAPGFHLPDRAATDLLLPLRLDEARERGRSQVSLVRLVGRKGADFDVATVRNELQVIRDRAEAEALERTEVPPVPSADATAGGGGPGQPGMQIQIRGRFGPGRGAGRGPGPPAGSGGARQAGPAGGPGAGPGPRFGPPESRVIVAPLHGRLVGDVRPALLIWPAPSPWCSLSPRPMSRICCSRGRPRAITRSRSGQLWGLAGDVSSANS